MKKQNKKLDRIILVERTEKERKRNSELLTFILISVICILIVFNEIADIIMVELILHTDLSKDSVIFLSVIISFLILIIITHTLHFITYLFFKYKRVKQK